MNAPGIIIRESGASSLSVMASPTAVPVFVGYFTSAEALASADEKCIRVDSWLDFSQRFVGSEARVTFTTAPPQHKATLAQETEAPSEKTSVSDVSVFKGETVRFDLAFPNSSESDQLWLKLEKANSGYGRQPAKLVCQPSGETFWLDFKTDTPTDITRSVPLPTNSISAELYLDTLFDKDPDQESFSLNASVADAEPDIYAEQCSASIVPVVDNVELNTRLDYSYFAVQHYFQNGGGPCYVLPLTTANEGELADLPSIIQEQAPDATLLLCAETDTTEIGIDLKRRVYAALDSLLSTQPSCFLIADSVDCEDKPSTTAEQTATYYPSLQTRLFSRPADEAIALDGYTDVDGKNVITLAALKLINPGAHGYVVEQIQSELGDEFVTLPPSAAIAGVYCTTDRERGVWKAPANIALRGVSGLTEIVSDGEQGPMNDKGINVIRAFSDRGMMVWGARTQESTLDWRYIPVRRLFNSVERDIQQMLRAVVFEPNNQATWERVRGAIDNHLRQLWRQGALLGNSEQEAYFVQVGENLTMTPDDIAEGKLIVKVGMAAVKPAEFIVLQFSQNVK